MLSAYTKTRKRYKFNIGEWTHCITHNVYLFGRTLLLSFYQPFFLHPRPRKSCTRMLRSSELLKLPLYIWGCTISSFMVAQKSVCTFTSIPPMLIMICSMIFRFPLLNFCFLRIYKILYKKFAHFSTIDSVECFS